MRLMSVRPLPDELQGATRFSLVAAADGMEWEAEALDMSRPTSDGRMIVQDGLSIRDTPLALLYCPQLGEFGHDGAVQVGTIQEASIDGSIVRMAGTWLDSPDPEVAAIIADVEQRTGTDAGLSVSVDLAVQKAVVTLVIPGSEEQEIEQAITEGEDVTVEIPVIDTETEVLRIDQCEIIGLTIVPQPAQDGLSIVNLSWEGPPEQLPVAASTIGEAFVKVTPVIGEPAYEQSEGLATAIQALKDADLPRQIEAMALAVDRGLLTEDEARERLGYAKLNGQRVQHDVEALTERIKNGEDVQGLVAQTLAKLEQRQPQVAVNVPASGSGARKVRVIKDDDGNVTGYESEDVTPTRETLI